MVIPKVWAMAGRWRIALVEPEMAAWTMTAFSKDCSVTMSRALSPILARRTDWRPASLANSFNSSQVAGSSALPGSMSPRASAMTCMVPAVPMNEQAPQDGQALCL